MYTVVGSAIYSKRGFTTIACPTLLERAPFLLVLTIAPNSSRRV